MCLPQIIIQSDHWKFQIFSRFIGVDWSLIFMRIVSMIKSTEDLKQNTNTDEIIISGKH